MFSIDIHSVGFNWQDCSQAIDFHAACPNIHVRRQRESREINNQFPIEVNLKPDFDFSGIGWVPFYKPQLSVIIYISNTRT